MKIHIIQKSLFILIIMIVGHSCSTAEKAEKVEKVEKVEKATESKPNKTVEKSKETDETAKELKNKTVMREQNPNRFNRILERSRLINPSLKDDGLHDPHTPALLYLQKPAEAFADLPKASSGNRVDWVKALDSGKIKPRHDVKDPNVQPIVMDLNIIMQVKGSMPDVVFPHKKHTQWLDCSNCHPAIFIPQSGANKMSMAENLMGKQCGVCHGKVAFPLSTCTKCHINKKVVVKKKK